MVTKFGTEVTVTRDDRSVDVEALSVSLGDYTLLIATSAGPRILGLHRTGGPDPFAKLGDVALEHPAIGRYRLLGGHRLWRAPEDPRITYQPDDSPVEVGLEGGIRIEGVEDSEGVVKQITVEAHGPYLVVDHILENRSDRTRTLAPWAITQVSPGGTAYMPMARRTPDENPYLPNRALVIWPYTDIAAPEYAFDDAMVQVAASERPSKMKIGTPNRGGWLGYEYRGHLFVKWSSLHDDAGAYADLGASAQCYRDERFLELETVGQLVALEGNGRVTHREVWQLIDIADRSLPGILAALPVHPEVESP